MAALASRLLEIKTLRTLPADPFYEISAERVLASKANIVDTVSINKYKSHIAACALASNIIESPAERIR